MSGKIIKGRQNGKKGTTSRSPTESRAARLRRIANAESKPLAFLPLHLLGRAPYSSRRLEFRTEYQALKSSMILNTQPVAMDTPPHDDAMVAGAPIPPPVPAPALHAPPTPEQEQMLRIEDIEAAMFGGHSRLSSLPSTPVIEQEVEDVNSDVESVNASTVYGWGTKYEEANVSKDAAAEDEMEDRLGPHSDARAPNNIGTLATEGAVSNSVLQRSSSPGVLAEDVGRADAKRKNHAGTTLGSSAPTHPQPRLSDLKGKSEADPRYTSFSNASYVTPNGPNQVNPAPQSIRFRSPVLDNGDQEPEDSAAQSHRKSSNLTEQDIVGDTVVAILRGEGEGWTLVDVLLAKMEAFNPRWNQRVVIHAIKAHDCLERRSGPAGCFYRYLEHHDSYRKRRLAHYVNIMDKLSTLP